MTEATKRTIDVTDIEPISSHSSFDRARLSERRISEERRKGLTQVNEPNRSGFTFSRVGKAAEEQSMRNGSTTVRAISVAERLTRWTRR